MANDAYLQAIKEILTDDAPARPTDRTPAEIEAAIEDISERLRGPLSNVERIWLLGDRRELRKQIATPSAGK